MKISVEFSRSQWQEMIAEKLSKEFNRSVSPDLINSFGVVLDSDLEAGEFVSGEDMSIDVDFDPVEPEAKAGKAV